MPNSREHLIQRLADDLPGQVPKTVPSPSGFREASYR